MATQMSKIFGIHLRLLAVAILTVVTVISGALVSASPVSAQSDDFKCTGTPEQCAKFREAAVKCLVNFGPIACNHADDAGDWVKSIENDLFPGQTEDGQIGNAFAHCAWIGALATRVGADDAYDIGLIHEAVWVNPVASREMDLANNAVGAQIGEEAEQSGTDDEWGYVMNECESRAKSGQLYGPCGVMGSYNSPYLPYDRDNPTICD